MEIWTLVLLWVLGYFLFVSFVLVLMKAAKRGDQMAAELRQQEEKRKEQVKEIWANNR